MFNVDVILRKSLGSSGNLLPRSLIDVNKRSGYEISLMDYRGNVTLFAFCKKAKRVFASSEFLKIMFSFVI